MSKIIELNFDGACTNNKSDGDLGLGFHAQYKGEEKGSLFKESMSGGIGTSNEAEYKALLNGLIKLVQKGLTGDIEIIGDSQVVIKQMTGEHSVRKYELVILKKQIEKVLTRFNSYKFKHVKREYNQLADDLSKEGTIRTLTDYYNYRF